MACAVSRTFFSYIGGMDGKAECLRLEHLKPLKSLKEVILWSTPVTRQGAEALQAALPDCDVSTSMF